MVAAATRYLILAAEIISAVAISDPAMGPGTVPISPTVPPAIDLMSVTGHRRAAIGPMSVIDPHQAQIGLPVAALPGETVQWAISNPAGWPIRRPHVAGRAWVPAEVQPQQRVAAGVEVPHGPPVAAVERGWEAAEVGVAVEEAVADARTSTPSTTSP